MDPLILRIPDVARRLGLPADSVRHLVQTGALPARKLGGRVVVLPDELDAFLRSLPKRGEAPAA
jgi:excisionase family DNA binding protein